MPFYLMRRNPNKTSIIKFVQIDGLRESEIRNDSNVDE